jgi:low temperature requirement protein LtrA
MMITQAVAIVVPSILWIASIYVEMPNRLALIFISLALDLFASIFSIFLIRGSKMISIRLSEWADRIYEFYPAINIEHKVARTDAFVTLIFGYSVVALLYQNTASFGVNGFYGKAVLGLIQAFAFNTLYFEIDGDSLWQHAIRRNVFSSLCWVTAHLPFLLGYSLAGASLSRLVVAHDSVHANVEDLTEVFMAKSVEHIEIGLRWFYCGGLGVALTSMGLSCLVQLS